MDQIGASHITGADILLFIAFIVLMIGLSRTPANSSLTKAFAVVTALLMFVAIGIVITVELTRDAVTLLSSLSLFLCLKLWSWNKARRKENQVSETHDPPAQVSGSHEATNSFHS